MDFTYLEKKAMVRLLMTLAIQDGRIDESEIRVIQNSLNVDNEMLASASGVNILDAIDTINTLSMNQKLIFSAIVVKVAEADGFIHPAESKLINSYFELTGISALFSM